MTESIKTLRKNLQAEKIAMRREYWGYKTFSRGPSIYITYPLLKTGIRPNHISVLVILVGIAGAIMVYQPEFSWKLFGLFLLYLNLVLDEVDGEIARYKKIYSLRGVYLDAINHLLVPPLFLGALALGLAREAENGGNLILFFGFLGALSWAILKANGRMAYQLYVGKYLGHEKEFASKEDFSKKVIVSKDKSSARKILAWRYQIREFFVAVVMFAAVLSGERLINVYHAGNFWLSNFLVFYGLFLFVSALEEVVKSWFLIEERVGETAKRFPV